MSLDAPKFEEFSGSSTSHRKLVNNLFLAACVTVSTLSIVILGILLWTIGMSALPTFGPHADHLLSENRFAIVQADENAEKFKVGDLVQGVFSVQSLQRGGLGETNDEQIGNEFSKLGFYSFEVAEKIRETDLDVLFRLKPASGENSLTNILGSQGIEGEIDPKTSIAILKGDERQVSVESAKFTGRLENDGKIAALDLSGDWEIDLLAGLDSETDFIELKLNSDSIENLKILRSKKKGGQLNGVLSVTQDAQTDRFQPVKVRSFETSELVSGQLKIDANFLKGLSRRSKNGFLLGGELDLVYCPLSENSASAWQHLSHFLVQSPKSESPEAGVGPAIKGSIWVILCCAVFALPIGVGTAIFLEEFKPTNKILLFGHSLVQLNISNLAGVPSIVYGILGLTAFAWMFGLFGSVKDPGYQFGASYYYQYVTEGDSVVLIPVDDLDEPPVLTDGMTVEDTDGNPIQLKVIGEDDEYPEDDSELLYALTYDAEGGTFSRKKWYYFQLPFGRGVLAASLTLMLVILPVIIISTQEALRSVPSSLREGALGLGSTPWQVVRKVTLPAAIPSIMTGSILSMSRAIGEAAPVLILCGIVYVTAGPQHLMDTYSVLPIQIYFWTSEPVDRSLLINFQNVAAAGIVILLVILLSFNAVAILIRQLTQKRLS